MPDNFSNLSSGLDSPADHAASVTPNNSTDLITSSRALYIGGGGDLALITVGGETLTFVGLAGGSILPVRASRVLATGTTATEIVAMW